MIANSSTIRQAWMQACRTPAQRATHTPPINYYTMTIVVALTIAVAPGVFAQTAATAERAQPSETTTMTLGEVVVSGNNGPLSTRSVLTSVDVLPSERIERRVTSYNWELFDQVPGAMITQFGQGLTSGKFSMRGFNGEGEINAVKLLLDGIPSNSNDGNMPSIDLAPRLDIESIEVVRGTNDPRYGLHNIAGNANIATKIGGNYGLGRATLGSFGTKELQLAGGIDRGGVSQNYAVGLMDTHGYRAHSDASSGVFAGKWFVTPGGGANRFGLIARHYSAKAQEAGYLTLAQRSADPDQSPAHNASDQDKRRVTQFALQGESQLGPHLFAATQAYLNDLDDRRFVRFSSTVSQQERYVAERHIGASGNLTWRLGATAIGDVALSGGADVERQDNRSERYNTVNQVRTAQTRNQQFDFNIAGAFVQALIKPVAALTITPAFRIDRITGSYTNLLNGVSYPANDYGLIKQPKLSAVYAFAPGTSVYGNWGRSFQVGVGTASYKVNQVADLTPSINEGYEAGVKFRPVAWLDGRFALWQQTASNEARRKLNDPANDAENIGETRRRGIDLQINMRPNQQWSMWMAAALQRSRILVADATALNTQGREIDHVPHLLYNLGVDYKPTAALRLSGWVTGQSSYYLERTNSTGRFGAYTIANLSAGYQVHRNVEVEFMVRNVTDRYSEYVWWDGAQSLHAPGSPRAYFVSLNIRL